ncbi:2-methylisoborneol synthase, partial [Streptomyces sp. NPDC055051]
MPDPGLSPLPAHLPAAAARLGADVLDRALTGPAGEAPAPEAAPRWIPGGPSGLGTASVSFT